MRCYPPSVIGLLHTPVELMFLFTATFRKRSVLEMGGGRFWSMMDHFQAIYRKRDKWGNVSLKIPLGGDTFWYLCQHQGVCVCSSVSFWTLELALCVSVHVLSRRSDHELKRRLMSQDMEAQTPICSLPHSGGCLSPQNPILSVNTHTYVYTAEAQQEGQGLRTVCLRLAERAHV